MEKNKYNLDNTKNCISDGNNTLIITYDKDTVLHPRHDQTNTCHLVELTNRLEGNLDVVESITDALKNLIADAHLDCGVLGLEEDDIEHKPEWCFNEILKAYNKELEAGNIQNSMFNQVVIRKLLYGLYGCTNTEQVLAVWTHIDRINGILLLLE